MEANDQSYGHSLISRLNRLTSTQESIEGLCEWITSTTGHHQYGSQYEERRANDTSSIWLSEFRNAPPTRRMMFIYLANDIIQRSSESLLSVNQSIIPLLYHLDHSTPTITLHMQLQMTNYILAPTNDNGTTSITLLHLTIQSIPYHTIPYRHG
jgi:hypothetical protein